MPAFVFFSGSMFYLQCRISLLALWKSLLVFYKHLNNQLKHFIISGRLKTVNSSIYEFRICEQCKLKDKQHIIFTDILTLSEQMSLIISLPHPPPKKKKKKKEQHPKRNPSITNKQKLQYNHTLLQ